jgi:hypothetical protein
LDYEIIKTEIIKAFKGEINFVDESNFKNAMSVTIRNKKNPIFYFPYIENKNKIPNPHTIPIGLNLISSDKNVLNSVSFFVFNNATEKILKDFQIDSNNEDGELIIIFQDNAKKEK